MGTQAKVIYIAFFLFFLTPNLHRFIEVGVLYRGPSFSVLAQIIIEFIPPLFSILSSAAEDKVGFRLLILLVIVLLILEHVL